MDLQAISLFSGGGGLDLGAVLAGGIKTVCYVENDEYAQACLMANIRRGLLHDAPIWDDVTTFDGKAWRNSVDLIFGGFPCQDVSVAGKQQGIVEGSRSGLWKEFHRIICEVQPRFLLIENVRGLVRSGLGVVLQDLSSAGYDAEWTVISASDVGAPHRRERVWIVASLQLLSDTNSKRGSESGCKYKRAKIINRGSKNELEAEDCVAYPNLYREQRSKSEYQVRGRTGLGDQKWWDTDPAEKNWTTIPYLGRVVNGMAFRSHQIRLLGNGVVPVQSVPAFERIKEKMGMVTRLS